MTMLCFDNQKRRDVTQLHIQVGFSFKYLYITYVQIYIGCVALKVSVSAGECRALGGQSGDGVLDQPDILHVQAAGGVRQERHRALLGDERRQRRSDRPCQHDATATAAAAVRSRPQAG